MVDRAALEMRSTGDRTGGSNPSLSATLLVQTLSQPRLASTFLLVSKGFGRDDRTSETAPELKFALRSPAVSFRPNLGRIRYAWKTDAISTC